MTISNRKLRKVAKLALKAITCFLAIVIFYRVLTVKSFLFFIHNRYLDTTQAQRGSTDPPIIKEKEKYVNTIPLVKINETYSKKGIPLHQVYFNTTPELTKTVINELSKINSTVNDKPMSKVANINCFGKTRDLYCILENLYKAEKTTGFNSTVTLTTQATSGLEYHVEQLCRRWQGPISVALYVPADDFLQSQENIEYLRGCGHRCVRHWVTWHLFYDQLHPPKILLLESARISTNTSWRNIVSKTGTSQSKCKSKPMFNTKSYVRRNYLPYPINVARNIARMAAETYYVFASDIELYPSENIVPRFIRLIDDLKNKTPNFLTKRQVFVLPVFEVELGMQPPTKKSDLRLLMEKKIAIPFHYYYCRMCHMIPKLSQWLKTEGSPGKLNIFLTRKRRRIGKYSGWEPFFIGTNKDPLFDERMSWNGKYNKMQVALELCFQNYDLHILDDAFLVHTPGIKKFDLDQKKLRWPFVGKNFRILKQIISDLNEKYPDRKNC
ncbi:beta-1,4-glucuronyltransferase 1-like [Tachypleus tridentatus]|uniref:beta-1,4-glucuronyltransferase 1-like n=1 Tax=Tachypleus tridentatus TaxID=6853 RepID=UPI003FD676E1